MSCCSDHHHGHRHSQAPPAPALTTVRIFTKADESYCVSVRYGEVVLAPTNPRDEFQHWIKDMRHGTRVNNIRLNFDALHGDEEHGGVHDGTIVVLYEWFKGKNQRWKIQPWSLFPQSSMDIPGVTRQPTVRVFTKANESYSLSVRNGDVVLTLANPRDEYQHWIKDMKHSTTVKDEEGLPSFALVNKVTGQAIKHSIGKSHPVRLVPYNPDYLDESVLWSESKDTGEGFRCIRMVNNIRLNFDAFNGDEDHGGVHDGTTVVLWEWLKGKNQRWKIAPYY